MSGTPYFVTRMAELNSRTTVHRAARKNEVRFEEQLKAARERKRQLSAQTQLMDLRCLIGLTLDQAKPSAVLATATALADQLADPTIDIYEACRRAVVIGRADS